MAQVTVQNVTFSYANVYEPKIMPGASDPKFSVQILIDKKDKAAIAMVEEAIKKATAEGITKGKFSETKAKAKGFKTPLRDGDEYYAEEPGPARAAAQGRMFFNATAAANQPPTIVDGQFRPISQESGNFYSGCIGHVSCSVFPYAHPSGSVGIGMGLNSIMKKRDGDRLDGRVSTHDAFAGLGDDLEENEAPSGDLE